MVPSDGNNPTTPRSSAVLPAPFGPTRATRGPAASDSAKPPRTARPDRAAHPTGNAEKNQQPQAGDIDAEALRRFLAKRQRAESAALAEQDDRAHDDEWQRQPDVLKTAVFQRAEQPERDFEHREGIAGEIHHQRGCTTRQARDREPRENQDQ